MKIIDRDEELSRGKNTMKFDVDSYDHKIIDSEITRPWKIQIE